MFANNQKISVRQLKRLLVMDWIGKISLLLPRYAARTSERDFILGIIIGALITILYTILVCYLSRYITGSFSKYVECRMGRAASFFICLVYWGYMFVNLVYITRVFGAITKEFMLPEIQENIPCIMLLLGGLYASSEPKERRGRMGEVLYPCVMIPLAILLVVAAFGMKPEHFTAGKANWNLDTVKHSFQVFTAFGGVGLILFESRFLHKGAVRIKAAVKGVLLTCIGILAVFIIGIGSFGEQGMKALSWPAITLMSNVEIPGGFLQRFDILFLALLLISFFVAASTAFHYLKMISTEMLRKGEDRIYAFPVLLLSVIGVLWCKNADIAEKLFITVNCYILVPIMTVFTVLFAVIEWEKRRRRR